MHSNFVQYSSGVLGDSELGVCINEQEFNLHGADSLPVVSLLSACILDLCLQSRHLTPTTVQYIVRLHVSLRAFPPVSTFLGASEKKLALKT